MIIYTIVNVCDLRISGCCPRTIVAIKFVLKRTDVTFRQYHRYHPLRTTETILTQAAGHSLR